MKKALIKAVTILITLAIISVGVGAVEYTAKVLPAGLPDLKATVSVDPGTIYEGDSLLIKGVVSNSGDEQAEDISYTIYVQRPNGNTRKVNSGTVNGLNPGESELVEFELKAQFKPGEYVAILNVDEDDLIEELDETNNTDNATFTVKPKPHRIIMWPEPFITRAGRESTITAQLKDKRGDNVEEAGVLIEFDTTRGEPSSNTAYTDSNGLATVTIKSKRAGIAMITGESEGLRDGHAFVIFVRGW